MRPIAFYIGTCVILLFGALALQSVHQRSGWLITWVLLSTTAILIFFAAKKRD